MFLELLNVLDDEKADAPTRRRLAFNAGSDARIAGRARRRNPYHEKDQTAEFWQWILGWADAHYHWAERNPQAPALPPVEIQS